MSISRGSLYLGMRAIEAAMAEVDGNVLRDILLKISEQLILDINIHNE